MQASHAEALRQRAAQHSELAYQLPYRQMITASRDAIGKLELALSSLEWRFTLMRHQRLGAHPLRCVLRRPSRRLVVTRRKISPSVLAATSSHVCVGYASFLAPPGDRDRARVLER